MKRYLVLLALLPVLFTASAGFAYEKKYEFKAKTIAGITDLDTDVFNIADRVQYDGLFYVFSVNTKFDQYQVYSRDQLDVLNHEVEIMTKYEDIRAGDEVMKGFGNTLVGVVKGLGEAVTHPIETVKRLPQGIGKMMNRIATFGRKHKAEGNKNVMQSLSSGEKRRIAVELDVDVYSTNRKLQYMLDQLAQYRTIGGGTLKIGAWFITGPAGIVYSIGSINDNVRDLIKNNNAIELEYLNNQRLQKMNIEETLRLKFLQNLMLTPTDQTIIVECLVKAGAIKNPEALVKVCAAAADKHSAYYYRKTAELMLMMKEQNYNLSRLYAIDDVIIAEADDMRFILLPADLLSYTPELKGLLDKIAATFEAKSVTLVTTGSVSSEFKKYLEKKTTIGTLEHFRDKK